MARVDVEQDGQPPSREILLGGPPSAVNQAGSDGVCAPFLQTEGPCAPQATPERQHRRTSLLAARDTPVDRDSHRVPGSQYFILAAWLSLLFVLYFWARIICLLGVPPDCTSDSDIVKVMDDFQYLILAGFVLAVITGVHWPDRFQYLFRFERPNPRGIAFLLACFGTVPAWGCFDLVPFLKSFSLSGSGVAGWNILLVILLGLGGAGLVAWHFWRAFAKNSWAGFLAYTLSRLGILCFYGGYAIAAASTPGVQFHLHHYVVGFLLASLAEFNHPVSLLLLGIGTGIFVQGISAYDADPIISVPDHYIIVPAKNITSPPMSPEAVDWVRDHCVSWS